MHISGFPARLGLMLVSLPQKRDGYILGWQNVPQSVPHRKFRPEIIFNVRRV